MIKIKNKQAVAKMRAGGKLLAGIVENLNEVIKPGMTTAELDEYVEQSMEKVGLKPACKGYGTYKHATCISLNDVVVHGIPSNKIIIKNGDLVKVDVVGNYEGYCVDMARCFFVGKVTNEVRRIVEIAWSALNKAIEIIKPGLHLSDISFAIQKEVEGAGYGVVRDFAGHGIGKKMHEDPEILNFGQPGHGPILRPGMTLAIEPMITQYNYEIIIDDDRWTVRTKDGGFAGHVEDTILVTENGAEILTRI